MLRQPGEESLHVVGEAFVEKVDREPELRRLVENALDPSRIDGRERHARFGRCPCGRVADVEAECRDLVPKRIGAREVFRRSRALPLDEQAFDVRRDVGLAGLTWGPG